MRFVDPTLSIHFHLRYISAGRALSDRIVTHSFLSFLTDIKESKKAEWDNSQENYYNPTSAIRSIKRYYLELNMTFDVLAETVQQVKNNKHSLKSIYDHVEYAFRESQPTFDPFDLEFAGFMFNKKYCGYITSFDANPDLDKGYFLEGGILYPKAYKVSMQFVVKNEKGVRPNDVEAERRKKEEAEKAKAARDAAALKKATAALTGLAGASPPSATPATVADAINEIKKVIGAAVADYKVYLSPKGANNINVYLEAINKNDNIVYNCNQIIDLVNSEAGLITSVAPEIKTKVTSSCNALIDQL